MAGTAQMFNSPDFDRPRLLKLLSRWGAYLLAGAGATLLLCVVGLFLGGGFLEPPVPTDKRSALIADIIPIEPEKKIIEVELDTEIPKLDVNMDNPMEVETSPLDIQYTINANLEVGVAVPAPPAMGGNTVFGVHQLETQPRIVHAPPPAYPRRAQQMKKEGVVKVRVVLDKEGKIVSSRLLPGDDVELFGAATLEAVKRWRFTPGKIGNRPVMCEVEIPVEYNLNK